MSLGGAAAQDGDRLLEFRFTPTKRAQIAIWIEDADGVFMETVALTSSVALRGVGNPPGAKLFPTVIFQDRTSEGFASRTTVDASPDSYFCLSFDQNTTTREALDAVTCASVFNSDKGRFATDSDVRNAYAEPFVGSSGSETMRPLDAGSIYPPRRDVEGLGQFNHPDVARFVGEARSAMPAIDAVTMATPTGDVPRTVQYIAPKEWEDGEYTAWIEVNVEGDYNSIYNHETYPTPLSEAWDFWGEPHARRLLGRLDHESEHRSGPTRGHALHRSASRRRLERRPRVRGT